MTFSYIINHAWDFTVETVTQFMEGIAGAFIMSQPPPERTPSIIITNIEIPKNIGKIVHGALEGVIKKQIEEARNLSFPPTMSGEYRRSGLFDFGRKRDFGLPVPPPPPASTGCAHCGTTGKDWRGNCAGCGATR